MSEKSREALRILLVVVSVCLFFAVIARLVFSIFAGYGSPAFAARASSFDSKPLLEGEKTLRNVNVMPLKDESILATGMLSLSLGILIGRFLHFEYSGFSVTGFAEGILTGLSLVLNLTYLIRKRRK